MVDCQGIDYRLLDGNCRDVAKTFELDPVSPPAPAYEGLLAETAEETIARLRKYLRSAAMGFEVLNRPEAAKALRDQADV